MRLGQRFKSARRLCPCPKFAKIRYVTATSSRQDKRVSSSVATVGFSNAAVACGSKLMNVAGPSCSILSMSPQRAAGCWFEVTSMGARRFSRRAPYPPLGLCLCLLRFGDEPELLHHAQGIEAVPALRHLAVGELLDRYARDLHPVTRGGAQIFCLALMGTVGAPPGHHLISFGQLVFYNAGEVREGQAHGCGVLLGAFDASDVSYGGLVADEVGGVDLLCGVEVTPLVVQLLKLPVRHGSVLFGGHALSPLSSSLPVV